MNHEQYTDRDRARAYLAAVIDNHYGPRIVLAHAAERIIEDEARDPAEFVNDVLLGCAAGVRLCAWNNVRRNRPWWKRWMPVQLPTMGLADDTAAEDRDHPHYRSVLTGMRAVSLHYAHDHDDARTLAAAAAAESTQEAVRAMLTGIHYLHQFTHHSGYELQPDDVLALLP